jgi:hypothetical protein
VTGEPREHKYGVVIPDPDGPKCGAVYGYGVEMDAPPVDTCVRPRGHDDGHEGRALRWWSGGPGAPDAPQEPHAPASGPDMPRRPRRPAVSDQPKRWHCAACGRFARRNEVSVGRGIDTGETASQWPGCRNCGESEVMGSGWPTRADEIGRRP